MSHSHSTLSLIGLLIVGLIVGGAGVYAGTHLGTLPSASTVTVTQSSVVTTATTVSGSTTSARGLTVPQFLSALQNSTSVDLTLKSFDYGKGTLSVWIVNSGVGPIVLSPTDVIYNKTNTGIAISFGYVDSSVTQVGVYAYIPVGSELYISATPPSPPVTGQNATLQIVNRVFNFTYGTSG